MAYCNVRLGTAGKDVDEDVGFRVGDMSWRPEEGRDGPDIRYRRRHVRWVTLAPSKSRGEE